MTTLRFFIICAYVLGLAEAACNDLFLGYDYPGATACYVDPKGGSNYGIPVRVYEPCSDNEVLYLSLAYTFPGGSVTRTETSANLGPATQGFETTFTFPIPHSYFPDSAVVTQTYSFDGAATPAKVVTSTKRYIDTIFYKEFTPITRIYASTNRPTTTVTISNYNTVYASQQTVTSTCNTGVVIRYLSTTAYIGTATYSPSAFSTYTPETFINYQSVRCTNAAGGVDSNLRPRLNEFEIESCYFLTTPPIYLYTTYYTVTAKTPTTERITGTYQYTVYAYDPSTRTKTYSPPPPTVTVCNSPARVTTSVRYNLYSTVITPVTTRATVTFADPHVVIRPTAPSVC